MSASSSKPPRPGTPQRGVAGGPGVRDVPSPGAEAPAPPDPLAASPSPSPTSDHPLTGSITPIRLLIAALTAVVVLVGMYLLIPKLVGLRQTWGQLRHGDPLWFAAGAVLELISIAGYAVLFRTVFGRGVPRIDWRASLEIPLAGIAAIRLIAAAGAGGVAVTVWALRQAGLSAEVIACRMVASLVVQYSVYLGALFVGGVGLWAGLFPGGGSVAITLVPAAIAVVMTGTIVGLALMPRDIEQRLARFTDRSGVVGWLAKRAVKAPAALGSGVRTAGDLARQRRLGLLGAVAYWGFDIAVLGVCFHAFGTVVPIAVLVVGYFLGTLGSLLPLPGGIGGVEGGMIGAFAAFGLPARSAVVAVLAYRAISFWLPTLPGVAGYVGLRSTVRHWRTGTAERPADAAREI
ncbi:MAG: putative heme transporter [Solirubrobacteraceae bacterium]|nr:putative heme transporter [Solirubrobacteraceae bacterium]